MKYLAVIITAALVSLIWVMSLAGFFRFPNALLYDTFVAHLGGNHQADSDILLIQAEDTYRLKGDEVWLTLLNNLEKPAPGLIVFTFLPEHASTAFYTRAHALKNVIFGRRIGAARDQDTSPPISPLPQGMKDSSIVTGCVKIPDAYHGIHRFQSAYTILDGKQYPALEYLALQKTYPHAAVKVPEMYRVNFINTPHIPNIDIERATSSELIPELVRDKIVLIGFYPGINNSPISVPIAPDRGISRLKFHGYALDTLISENIIKEIPSPMKLIIIFLMIVFSLIIYQFLNIHLFSYMTLPLIFFYLTASWLALSLFHIWLPLSEIFLAHVSTLYFVFSSRTRKQDKATRKMLFYSSMKWRERYLPESFYNTDAHWSQVINMVKQTLELSRTIFLERVKGDHRVKEVIALNCSLSDINERRRDYERTPYSTAIEDGGPIKMMKFSYLTKSDEEESQYLVPLMFGGQILGFWAFGIHPSRVLAIENFRMVIMNFADQIGELLYRREQKRIKDIEEGKAYLKYLHLEGRDAAYQDLNRSILLIEQRLRLLETVFHGMGLATILYDLFGRVIHVNKNMTELLKNSDLLPYEITAMDFITKLCKLPPDEIRSLLRKTIFEHEPFTLSVFLPVYKEKSFMIRVRPLSHEKTEEMPDEAYPFKIFGILLEIVEITEVENLNRFKMDLLEDIGYQVRKDFASILMATALMKRGDLTDAQKKTVHDIFDRRVTRTSEYFNRAQIAFGEDFHIGMTDNFSIDPMRPVKDAIMELKPMADTRNVTFKINIPESRSLLCSNPDALADVIKSLLEYLIQDAADQSHIYIDMLEEYDEWLILNLANQGFGMPNDDFQRFLNDTSDNISFEFRKIQSASQKVNTWGGSLSASSAVGTGTKFMLYFKMGKDCHLP